MSPRAWSLAFVLLGALALPAWAGAASPAPPVSDSVRLSDERTLTRWAHPVRVAPIRWLPRTDARRITPTHLRTEDGFPEVYLVLRKWDDPRGSATWLQVRIPMRPNGRVGWVREEALGPLYGVTTFLRVDRRRLRATLFKKGRRIWSSRVGIGTASTPTPAGNYWIREKFRTNDPGGPYGPAAFGTSDYSVLSDWPGGGIIGIHGTSEPHLIPGRPSHGCIRLRNRPLRRLYALMPVGTPLQIR